MYARPKRFSDMLAAFKSKGEQPPEAYRETIEQWAQMEARRLADAILAMPKQDRREAIDVHAGPFREIVEREVLWLYQLRKERHERLTQA